MRHFAIVDPRTALAVRTAFALRTAGALRTAVAACAVLAACIAFAACSAEEQPPTAALSSGPAAPAPPAGAAFEPAPRKTITMDPDAAKLVPAAAAAVLHVRQPGALLTRIKALVDSFQPGMGALMDIQPALKETGLRERDLDMDRASTVAVVMGDAGPVLTYILPAKKPADAADVAAIEAVASGGYVGLATSGKPAAGEASKFAADLPDGDVVLRVNAPVALVPYWPILESMLDANSPQLQGLPLPPNTKGVLQPILDKLREMLRDLQTLDVAISFADGALDVDIVATTKSPFNDEHDGDFDLLARIPLPGPNVLFYTDLGVTPLVRLNSKLAKETATGKPAGKNAQEVLAKAESLFSKLGREIAVAYRAEPRDIKAVAVVRRQDGAPLLAAVQDYVTQLRAALQATGGQAGQAGQVVDLPKQTLAGVEFHGWQVDTRALSRGTGTPTVFSIDELGLSMGTRADHAIFTIGDVGAHVPNLVAAIDKEASYESPILKHVEGLHARPRLFYAMDMVAPLRIAAAARNTVLPDVESAILWVSFAASGKRRELQFHADLKGMAGVVRAIGRPAGRQPK